MRSKKITQLNKSQVQQIKTVKKRVNTNKTKKRGKRVTQKAGASATNDDDDDDDDDTNLPTTGAEAESLAIAEAESLKRKETTVERALREQRELEEKIEKEIEEMGYDIKRIQEALANPANKHKLGNIVFNKKVTYDNLLTYGKAYQNKAIKKIAKQVVKEKNPSLEKESIKIMARKLLNYVHNKHIEKEGQRYNILSKGLHTNDVLNALESDEDFAEVYVDRINREIETRIELGEDTNTKVFQFFKLASNVFDPAKIVIAKKKLEEFKDLMRGTPQPNRFVLFFQKLNKELKGPFTTEQIESKVELMFKLYKIRTTISKYYKFKTPWFKPLSEYSKEFKDYRYRKYSGIQKSLKRSVSEFLEDGYEECSLIKELSGNERSLVNDTFSDKIIRHMVEGDFFKKEDKYFLGLIEKNARRFCFKNEETADEYEYFRFCKRLTKCLKTPNLLHELLFDAIDAKATKRMYDQLSSPQKESIRTRMQTNSPEAFKKLGDNADERDTLAVILTLIQDENLHSLSKFLKQVIIQTFLEYKEASGKAPQGTYTGNIVAEPYFDDIFKLLTEKTKTEEEAGEGEEGEEGDGDKEGDADEEENTNNNQSGGSKKVSYKTIKKEMVKSGSKPIYTAAELKRISEEDLYKGLKNCDKKDLIKSDYEKRVQDGTGELGNEFDRNDDEIESIGEGMETPKLLYILMGSLIVVGIIESGFLDAPPCMTHTII